MAPKRSPGSDPSSPPNDKRPRTDEQREHQQAQSAPTHATRTYNVSTGQAPAWDMGSPRQASSRPGSSSGPLDPHLTNRGADRAALDTRRRSTSNVPASVAVSSGCSMHQDGNGSNARSPTDSAVTATSGATEISHHSHVRTAPIAQMIPLPASGVPSQTTYIKPTRLAYCS
ncbi:hypothetical protein GQ43DRAFT_16416 [Delitschia confertaspora ATCC 74209]|uniref:Uncharacterized protein n=1 Tax=Delitschia confertaspora ATCC 74209 TaxID=1513339 RepID=A0A9P4MW63_9PLEO|nr:hypothetical protein GQ43DRAFT_16416 [Delitschia confertaspora ATCC 74209]